MRRSPSGLTRQDMVQSKEEASSKIQRGRESRIPRCDIGDSRPPREIVVPSAKCRAGGGSVVPRPGIEQLHELYSA